MMPRLTLLLNLLVVCGLALSGLLIPGRVASGAGEAVGSAPAVINPAAHQLDLDRVGNWLKLCGAAASIPLVESKLCTHGPDLAPADFDVDTPIPPLLDQDARDEMAVIGCDGDGRSGYRVQVLYVHGSNVQSRYDQFRLSIQGWSGQMDRIFQASAAETGGVRGVRFVHDTSCQPIVTAAKVSPAGIDSFDSTITELKALGYNRANRIYLAFVDTTSAGICGIGTIWNDDRASGSVNWNNAGPSYARVDAGCWSGQVAAHEVMHNLGGVQLSAPNTSAAFHCIDEWDVMCYSDRSGTTTRQDCANQVRDTTLFDCNHNDYYDTNPAPGSYLASYWNPAGNRFLLGSPAPAAAPDTSQETKQEKKGKKNEKKGKSKKSKKGKKGKQGKQDNKGKKGKKSKHKKRR